MGTFNLYCHTLSSHPGHYSSRMFDLFDWALSLKVYFMCVLWIPHIQKRYTHRSHNTEHCKQKSASGPDINGHGNDLNEAVHLLL